MRRHIENALLLPGRREDARDMMLVLILVYRLAGHELPLAIANIGSNAPKYLLAKAGHTRTSRNTARIDT